MIKKFENFKEIDPYGEEDWSDLETINKNTDIEAGNIIYWNDGHEFATVDRVDNETYDDVMIYGTIFQSNVDKGWANMRELIIDRNGLIHASMKIKK